MAKNSNDALGSVQTTTSNWLPTYSGSTSPPTLNYTEQYGGFVKLGSLVCFSLRLGIAAATGGSGVLLVGLPLNASAQGGGQVRVDFANFTEGLVIYNRGANPLVGKVQGGTPYFSLRSATTSSADFTVEDLRANAVLHCSGFFFLESV